MCLLVFVCLLVCFLVIFLNTTLNHCWLYNTSQTILVFEQVDLILRFREHHIWLMFSHPSLRLHLFWIQTSTMRFHFRSMISYNARTWLFMHLWKLLQGIKKTSNVSIPTFGDLWKRNEHQQSPVSSYMLSGLLIRKINHFTNSLLLPFIHHYDNICHFFLILLFTIVESINAPKDFGNLPAKLAFLIYNHVNQQR